MLANFQLKDVQVARVQGNPKTHKDGNDVRLIVNSRGLPTVNIAKYVEEQLHQHVINQGSYIKDTKDFIQKLAGVQLDPQKSYSLFCMDVKSLYPSVPREQAKEAVKDALLSRSDQETSVDTILELMDLVLENNYLIYISMINFICKNREQP